MDNNVILRQSIVCTDSVVLCWSKSNSIFWKNEQIAVTECPEATYWYNAFICGFNFSYCCIPELASFELCYEPTLFEGIGNINTDPLFIDPLMDNYRLSENSPCKDAGNPSSEYIDRDGTINDMGAYGGPTCCW